MPWVFRIPLIKFLEWPLIYALFTLLSREMVVRLLTRSCRKFAKRNSQNFWHLFVSYKQQLNVSIQFLNTGNKNRKPKLADASLVWYWQKLNILFRNLECNNSFNITIHQHLPQNIHVHVDFSDSSWKMCTTQMLSKYMNLAFDVNFTIYLQYKIYSEYCNY